MSTGLSSPERAQIGRKTLRQDNWWVAPLLTFLVFTSFVVYATIRAFMGTGYYSAPYLSPFFSPCLATSCVEGSSDLGTPIGDWWRLSPALIILVFPLGFRMTCYYYRKSYYRSFWLSPPACAVADAGSAAGGKRPKYNGESRFPLIIQNMHRYFWYFAVIFGVLLSWDAIQAFRFPNGFGVALGTLI